MVTHQYNWTPVLGWKGPEIDLSTPFDYVLAFGGVDEINQPERYNELQNLFPGADLIMVSTAGEISDGHVKDGTITATGISYSKTQIRVIELDVASCSSSFECGQRIKEKLEEDNLSHILVLSDGNLVNGDKLVEGVTSGLSEKVLVTGGLAADAGRFTETFVGLNKAPQSGKIVAIGHYGDDLIVSHGSKGGWDEFGPIRSVTKSEGNVLFELDGKNAFEIYKTYLGDRIAELPGAALLFPLSIQQEDGSPLVRTILSIDQDSGAMTFAGDIPTGSNVRFMMANFDRLIDGAASAADQSQSHFNGVRPEFVLMISCVGRKIVLDQRIDEEVESVIDKFGSDITYSGFYSNGEISPILDNTTCSLQNQTMTITAYSEK